MMACILEINIIFSCCISVTAKEDVDLQLYSLSACLIDGDSGRILYGKEEEVKRAMASTTKIMTCIIALEYGNLDDMVKISKYAASMPKVKLYAKENEYYKLEDLLYSLMLESHNDVAVAIAEHIAGSVEAFASMMNKKAEELGCFDTYFITPNGLDGTKNVNGVEEFHSTTAYDLCKIMAYCIKNNHFLKITNTMNYSFSNYVYKESQYLKGSRSHNVSNTNAFLSMMDGVLSGKTGFTGKAGYCYVAALEKDDRCYVIALLGCGWPNNKTYKWSDSKKLFNYGLENYDKMVVNSDEIEVPIIYVKEGVLDDKRGKIKIKPYVVKNEFEMILSSSDEITYIINIPEEISAPIEGENYIGEIVYYVNDKEVCVDKIYVNEDVLKYDFKWCIEKVFKTFF